MQSVRLLVAGLLVVVGLLAIAPGAQARSATGAPPDPPRSLRANPDYFQSCAISGVDDSPGCLQVALQAIDNARKKERLGPLRLPSNYAGLPFDEQMLLVVNGERVARRLSPVVGLVGSLDQLASQGAAVDDLAPRPGGDYTRVKLDAAAGFANPLDLDYQWLYDDGPGSGTSGCRKKDGAGCWADRNLVLARFPGTDELVMGAAQDPIGDTQPEDKGGATMALVLAQTPMDPTLTLRWSAARPAKAAAALLPLDAAPLGISPTGIADPPHTETPHPDYLTSCTSNSLDDSPTCLAATLAAINHARAAEGVRPMVLPSTFAEMSTAEQLFVVVNLERVDRNLPPFAGMTAEMDANAARGADLASDPPDPQGVLGDDEEWAGGAFNALDADYGWMYNDGRGSGNLDCPRTGGAGCWDHRHGILDAFGSVGTMVFGAAFDANGDRGGAGWAGGTSMAVTMAVQLNPPQSWLVTWAQIVAGGTPS